MRASVWRSLGVMLLVAVLGPATAHAKKPFGVSVNASNSGGGAGETSSEFSSVQETINFLDPAMLRERFPTADTDALSASLDFRGLSGITIAFDESKGFLTFTVPQFGFAATFGDVSRSCFDATECAADRRLALNALQDFLESDPTFLRKLLTFLARFSPIDPLAGNPDSLFSSRMRNDFNYGFTHKVSQIWGCGTSAFNFTDDAPIMVAAVGGVSDIFADAQARAAALQAQNEIGVGLLASNTTARVTGGEYVTTSITLPISYTAKIDSDPRKKVRFDLPLTYMDTEGAASYSAGAGLAYSHPLTDDWSLTPAIGVGATGSEDLGAAGGVGAFSLTSAYTWRFDSFALSMGNAVGQYESLGIKIGDVEAEAEVANTVFTNGLLLTGPNSLIARNLVVEYSLVNTQITGDEVYADSYNEIGVALGYINTSMGVIDSYTKLGVSYLVSDGAQGDIDSIRLNLLSRF